MRVFLKSHAVSYIYLSRNQAKYLTSSWFVTMGQHDSDYFVFAWVLRLIFPRINTQSCMRHDCCTYTRSYTGTAYVS